MKVVFKKPELSSISAQNDNLKLQKEEPKPIPLTEEEIDDNIFMSDFDDAVRVDDDFSFTLEEPADVTEEETKTPDVAPLGLPSNLASALNNLIIDEFEAIEGYNNTVASFEFDSAHSDAVVSPEYNENWKSIMQILKDIAKEENIHVGQLQKALSLISPSAEAIKEGEKEAEEQIAQDGQISFAGITDEPVVTVAEANIAHPFMSVQPARPVVVASQGEATPAECPAGDEQCSLLNIDDEM